MIATHVQEADLQVAAMKVQVVLNDLRQLGPQRFRFTLRPDRDTAKITVGPRGGKHRSNYRWQRTSASYYREGTRIFAVCWHGHKAFLDELFKLRPDAIVRSGLGGGKVVHRGQVDLATAWIPLGARITGGYPRAAEACMCPYSGTDRSNEPSVEFGQLGESSYTHIRSLSQSALRACPHFIMVPEHYRIDNSCRCDDPDAPEMADWGYTWDGTSWK